MAERFWDTEPLLRESWLAPLDEVRAPLPTPDTVELPRRQRGTAAGGTPAGGTLAPKVELRRVTQAAEPTVSLAAQASSDRRAWPVAAVVAIGVLAVLVVAFAG